ncbi:MAG: helix-turn-helix transcriptional regulator [Acidimicrobiales bacterium]
MSEVLKARRAELGISQNGLADMAGVNVRQIARYESGEQQPVLSVAVQLADALSISLAELAGQISSGQDLDGQWFAGWETFKDGVRRLAIQEVTAHQHGQHLQVTADRTVAVEEGGYNWAGELRVWDNEVLMGWYRGADGSVRSKGTMYFAIDSSGNHATGRWVGMSYDGNVITGNSSLARTAEQAESILQALVEKAAT